MIEDGLARVNTHPGSQWTGRGPRCSGEAALRGQGRRHGCMWVREDGEDAVAHLLHNRPVPVHGLVEHSEVPSNR